MAKREEFQTVVPHQGVEQVTTRLDLPEIAEPRAVYVLAHGAGAPMTSDFLEAVSPRLADAAGVAVLRFNYGYAEKMSRSGSRLPPEKRRALEVVHRALFQSARERFGDLPLIGGGKSMGGRIASLMCAEGEPMGGLAFLGYPLHPAGKPEKLRVEHFPELNVPTLFLQGDRDALCDLALLEPALRDHGSGQTTLHVVEGADHGFTVLKRSGRTPDDVLNDVAAAFSKWCLTLL